MSTSLSDLKNRAAEIGTPCGGRSWSGAPQEMPIGAATVGSGCCPVLRNLPAPLPDGRGSVVPRQGNPAPQPSVIIELKAKLPEEKACSTE